MAEIRVFSLPVLLVFANFLQFGITDMCLNDNGYYNCPLPGQDDGLVNCCGDLNSQYCCYDQWHSLATVIASAIGSAVALIIGIVVICCCCPCCLLAKRRQRGIVIAVPQQQQQPVSNVNVILPASQNYIMPANQNVPYPPQVPYPAQQYPVPQYPAQQYPAQQYPAQQYPAQQYPAQQYPAQPPPPYQMHEPPQYTMQPPNEPPTMGHCSGHPTAPYYDQLAENPGSKCDKQPLLKNAN